MNFDANSFPVCKTYKEKTCLLPDTSTRVHVSGKDAQSFRISVENTDSGTSVLHVIQFAQYPLEISMSVDGAGLEEQFQEILSTLQFVQ